MAFRFLQWLSNFFNGFPIFLNSFLIFFNRFPLSNKSEKIYLRRQVYERSPFELCISRHLLPKLCNRHSLPELCNCHLLPKLRNCHLLPKLRNRYNACISPNTFIAFGWGESRNLFPSLLCPQSCKQTPPSSFIL